MPVEPHNPQTFTAMPEVPTDSATLTRPIPKNLVVSSDRVFEVEAGPRAPQTTPATQVVTDTTGRIELALLADQGQTLPQVTGTYLSLAGMRLGCEEGDGKDNGKDLAHIGNPALQEDAMIGAAHTYQVSPRARSVMPADTESLLPIVGQLRLLRSFQEVLTNVSERVDARIKTLENRGEVVSRGAPQRFTATR